MTKKEWEPEKDAFDNPLVWYGIPLTIMLIVATVSNQLSLIPKQGVATLIIVAFIPGLNSLVVLVGGVALTFTAFFMTIKLLFNSIVSIL